VIRNFSDHAANERTFLAWVRTALAVVGFGLALLKIDFLPHGMSVWLGFALVGIGCGILALAGWRFLRTSHEIDRQETFRAGGVRSEIALSALLLLFVIAFGVLLWTASGS
jgi:putative membrane protein